MAHSNLSQSAPPATSSGARQPGGRPYATLDASATQRRVASGRICWVASHLLGRSARDRVVAAPPAKDRETATSGQESRRESRCESRRESGRASTGARCSLLHFDRWRRTNFTYSMPRLTRVALSAEAALLSEGLPHRETT